MSTLTLRTAKGSPLTNAEVDANFTNLLVALGGVNTSPYTVPTPTGTGSPVLSTAPTLSTAYIGTQANATRFPNALAAVASTASGIQQNESHNIGLIAEGTAHASDANVYGIGLYGVGYTSATTRCGGVVGEAHVSASSDIGSAIGVRGYSNDIHAGGLNVGLYGDATSGSSNYALYLNSGDIYAAGTKSWILNGDLTFSGAYNVVATDFNTTSDLTLKENVQPIIEPLKIINSLNGVSFNWKENGNKAYGFIAQDVETILPELVSTHEETNVKSIKYNQLIAFLTEAVKQQNSVIVSMEQRIRQLEK